MNSPPLLILVCILSIGMVEPQPQLEIGGVWVESSALVSQTTVDETLNRVDRGYFNLVNALVFEQGYAFWDSKMVQKSPSIDPGFDPLLYLVKEAHNRGIQVHTWVIVGPVGLWDGEKGPVLSTHPGWALQNPCRETYANWLDVSQKEVRAFWCGIVSEIATTYEVDGIHLDYIRYPGEGWGYNPAFFKEYTEKYGIDEGLLLKETLPLYSFFDGNPLSEVTTGEVLAAFDNGVPAVVLNKYGEGMVILFNWNVQRCEPKATERMMQNALTFLAKERTYVFYAPETVAVYGWAPFSSIWDWAEKREPHWLEEEWFDPDPQGVVLFPYTYYLSEEAISKLEAHVRAGGAAIFIDGPVFAAESERLRSVVGMGAVGDYFWGEHVLVPAKEHEIIPSGEEYSVAQFKEAERWWEQFRKEQVTETVKEIRTCIPVERKLTAAVFQNKRSADTVLQDWYSWMDYLDYAVPMAYVSELEELQEDLDEWERVFSNFDHIYAGLSVTVYGGVEKKKSAEDVIEEIELCRKRGVKGVILFDLESMDNNLLDELAKSVFSSLVKFDYSPPEIEELQVEAGNPVVMVWKTDEPCTACLHYRAQGVTAWQDSCDKELKEDHKATLDLQPDTVYVMVLLVQDEAGNQSTQEITFRTAPAAVRSSESPPGKSRTPLLMVSFAVAVFIMLAVFLLLKKRE